MGTYNPDHLVAHVSDAGHWSRLVAVLEEPDFIGARWVYEGSLQRLGEVILEKALPLARRRADWVRFTRFAATVIALGRLRESLSDLEVVEALVASGQTEMAEALTARAGDLWARAPRSGTPHRGISGTRLDLGRSLPDLKASDRSTRPLGG